MDRSDSRKQPVATRLILLCLFGAATVACSSDSDVSDETSDEAASAGHAGASQRPSGAGTRPADGSSSTNSRTTTLASDQTGGAQNTSVLQSGGAIGSGGNPGSVSSGPPGGGAIGSGGNPGSVSSGPPGGGSGGTMTGGKAGAENGNTALGNQAGTGNAGGNPGANGGAGGNSNGAGAGGPNSANSSAGSSGTDTGHAGNAGDNASEPRTAQVPAMPLPTVETESFTPTSSTSDIADDCAIYANPIAPELSVVVADNKDAQGGGVGVFDMQGRLLQFRQAGQIGNIDLRTGFPFGGQSIILVGANNRTTNQLNFWQLDAAARTLSAPIGETPESIVGSYGFCMYRSRTSGKFYAFVTEFGRVGAQVEQYELSESDGAVAATRVRSFALSGITEGCVADDDLSWLYVAEEDLALWRYGAEPETGADRVQVAAVGDDHLVADLEGVSLAKGPGTSGYLILSIQSEDRFVIFDRESNAYVGGFSVGGNGSIDAVSQTDGLDISTGDLGPGFPKGALVVHDGSNADGASSNLKYIPLQ